MRTGGKCPDAQEGGHCPTDKHAHVAQAKAAPRNEGGHHEPQDEAGDVSLGGPAVSARPAALRPGLATGFPFSTENEMGHERAGTFLGSLQDTYVTTHAASK